MKKIGIISFLLLIVFTISFYVLKVTYSLIISVSNINGLETVSHIITLHDLVTNEEGGYIHEYYDAKDRLGITEEEAKIIIDSPKLNDVLNVVLENVVDYRFNKKDKITKEEILKLLVNATNNDVTINNELKTKIITKSKEYIDDIVKYLYEIKTSLD